MARGETYEEFVEKFKPKKTTDDCYTPPEVYDEVKAWVAENVMPLAEGVEIVRPFRPGGDYQAEAYPEGCLVLDNPPFSILAQIVDWYIAHGVKFFLFAPQLTLFNYSTREAVTAIVANVKVTYENGAVVNTSFLTNCYPGSPAFIVAGDLCLRVEKSDKRAREARKGKRKPIFEYPPQLVNAAILGKLCQRGIRLSAPRGETRHVRRLDSGRAIFGAGFLLSDRLAAERMEADRLAADRLAAERKARQEKLVLELSDRERQIVASLSGR